LYAGRDLGSRVVVGSLGENGNRVSKWSQCGRVGGTKVNISCGYKVVGSCIVTRYHNRVEL